MCWWEGRAMKTHVLLVRHKLLLNNFGKMFGNIIKADHAMPITEQLHS